MSNLGVLVTLIRRLLLLMACMLLGNLLHASPAVTALSATFIEFHDPGWLMLELEGSDQVEIAGVYDSIGYDELSTWRNGEALEIGYSDNAGVVLRRLSTGKDFAINFSFRSHHPISVLSDKCLDKALSTMSIIICYETALRRWDIEIQRLKESLIATNPKNSALEREINLLEENWLVYKSAYFSVRKNHFQGEGSIASIEWSGAASAWRENFYFTLLTLLR